MSTKLKTPRLWQCKDKPWSRPLAYNDDGGEVHWKIILPGDCRTVEIYFLRIKKLKQIFQQSRNYFG